MVLHIVIPVPTSVSGTSRPEPSTTAELKKRTATLPLGIGSGPNSLTFRNIDREEDRMDRVDRHRASEHPVSTMATVRGGMVANRLVEWRISMTYCTWACSRSGRTAAKPP